MSAFTSINFQIKNRVATIALNRPETMNAISQQMRQEMLIAIQEIETNKDVRTVILTGEGRGFSSGGDLAEGLSGYDTVEDKILAEYVPIFQAIQQSAKIYMSVIHGPCTGIASGIAMLCDLSIMSEDAYLYIPFAGLNLVPDGGMSYQLVKHLGYKKAMEIYTNAEKIRAAQCLQYGLVNRVVHADDLEVEARNWAEKLATGAPLAHKLGKQCLQKAMQNSLSEVMAFEAKQQVICTNSPDTVAAVNAVLNKKAPCFANAEI